MSERRRAELDGDVNLETNPLADGVDDGVRTSIPSPMELTMSGTNSCASASGRNAKSGEL